MEKKKLEKSGKFVSPKMWETCQSQWGSIQLCEKRLCELSRMCELSRGHIIRALLYFYCKYRNHMFLLMCATRHIFAYYLLLYLIK